MFKVLQKVPHTTVRCCAEGTLHSSMSREAALRALAALMANDSAVSAEELAAAALAREAEENTYIGRGLAVPHARMEGLSSACVCLAACPEGLEWGEQRATLVALLAVPAERPELHLRLLSALARQLSTCPAPELSTLAAALENAC